MGGQPLERLRHYLRGLSPAAQALLIAELERAASRGEEVPGGDLVLQEVRRAMRDNSSTAPRHERAARLFFRAVEPFVVDDGSGRKHPGRIARSSLGLLWAWISRDLVPSGVEAFAQAVEIACSAERTAACEQLVCGFQDRVADHIQGALAAAASDETARRRLVAQLGEKTGLDDLSDLGALLKARDAFALLTERLPSHIHNLADAQLDGIKALLDSPAARRDGMLVYALVLVMGRLAAPWQLVRLATKSARTDAAERAAATPYAAAVSIVLAEIERMADTLKTELRRGSSRPVTSLIKSIHEAVRGLRTELDLSVDSPWSRALATVRGEVSSVLKAEIESMPGRVRRLLRPRPAREIASGAVLDAGDVADTEALIELVGVCGTYAGELAVSETSTRCLSGLQHYLDTGIEPLLEGLRNAGAQDRPFRQSQVEAAVRFCAKVFARDYASLLTRAAEIAGRNPRKAVARA